MTVIPRKPLVHWGLTFLVFCVRLHAQQFLAYKDESFTAFFRRTSGWVAGDGAFSVPLADGRVLWLFGDSHVDDLDATGTMPCLFQTRNAGLVQERDHSQKARTLVGKGPGFRSWLKNSSDDNVWFWPSCGFQHGHTVWIYLSGLRKKAVTGPFGFESTGQDYWARVSFPELKPQDYVALPAFNGISFGYGLVSEDAYEYAFGAKQNGLASDVFVARFRTNQPQANWEFWNGKQWSPAATSAQRIAQGRSNSIHVCRVKDKFLLTTSQFSVGCDQGKEIYMATSRSATGPFSPFKSVFTIDDLYQGHLPFFYLPIAHPEFTNAKGELLVTYSINNYEPCISACVNGRAIPDHYRPKAIRVPLKLIDPEL